MTDTHTFGQTVRALRQGRGIGLREFARQLGVSAAYITAVEKDACAPPTEDRVIAIARTLGQNPDELLALAGRVASDVETLIRDRPIAMATFLRVAGRLSEEELKKLTEQIQEQL